MKIAAAQIACSLGDIAANLKKIRDFAEAARAAAVEWVVFPEMTDTGYAMPVIRKQARPWDTGAVPAIRQIAQSLSIGIICGLSEREGDCIYNTQAVIDAAGEIVGKYRKTHLFAPIEEDKFCTPGGELVCLSLGPLRAGLTICYDLRFPEIYRALTVEHGVNLFLISSAWPFPRVEHQRVLATARAIENQSYVVLANRVGRDEGVPFCGSSAVIDPYGVVVATGSTDEEELLVAEISAAQIRKVRDAMPVLSHRRPDLYGLRG